MATREIWAERVAARRASGLTSPSFCEDKEFTPGGLRYWAHQLEKEKHSAGRRPAVRLARVVRVASVRASPATAIEPVLATSRVPHIVIAAGEFRVGVSPGVDRATLTLVLDVLASRGAAG